MIKALTDNDITRPATIGPIIEKIKEMGYVQCSTVGSRNNVLTSTPLGREKTAFLEATFPEQMDIGKTKKNENGLREVVEGATDSGAWIDASYQGISPHIFKNYKDYGKTQKAPK